MLVVAKNNRITGFIVFIPLMLFAFQFLPGVVVAADGHKKGDRDDTRHEIRGERHDSGNRTRRKLEKEDDGNEVTGQAAAWLLVAANITIAISILVKSLGRYFYLEPATVSATKRSNQFQKRHLMRFHYVLNPAALGVAGIHFSLSSCRSSPLPEWGLMCMAAIIFLGFTVKFKLAPKRIKQFVYRLHTGLAGLSLMVVLLVAGHMVVD